MSNHFYVTLPSSSDMSGTAAQFRVKLAERLKLGSAWEVGLSEIIYPNSWYNIRPGENSIRIHYVRDDDKSGQLFVDVIFPAGRYSTIGELMGQVNCFIDKLNHPVVNLNTIQFEKEPGFGNTRILLVINENRIQKIGFSVIMAKMFGFDMDENGWIKTKQNDDVVVTSKSDSLTTINGSKYADLDSSSNESFYIYSNIVKNQHVGHLMAPLLRIVDAHGASTRTVKTVFDRPHYVPLLIKDIEHIEINIKTEQNQIVSFTEGASIITLHFKQRSLLF
jgi:hypothetical protein